MSANKKTPVAKTKTWSSAMKNCGRERWAEVPPTPGSVLGCWSARAWWPGCGAGGPARHPGPSRPPRSGMTARARWWTCWRPWPWLVPEVS